MLRGYLSQSMCRRLLSFSRNVPSGVQGMCRQTVEPVEPVEIEEEVLEFNLIERLTFLEYLPVKSGLRKSSSSPELTVCDQGSTGGAKESWDRQVSVSTACSSAWSRQESTKSLVGGDWNIFSFFSIYGE